MAMVLDTSSRPGRLGREWGPLDREIMMLRIALVQGQIKSVKKLNKRVGLLVDAYATTLQDVLHRLHEQLDEYTPHSSDRRRIKRKVLARVLEG